MCDPRQMPGADGNRDQGNSLEKGRRRHKANGTGGKYGFTR